MSKQGPESTSARAAAVVRPRVVFVRMSNEEFEAAQEVSRKWEVSVAEAVRMLVRREAGREGPW